DERPSDAALCVVINQVAPNESVRPVAQADDEDLAVAAVTSDARAVLFVLVVGIRVAGRVRPPPPHVRLEEPPADLRQIRLGERREVELRLGRTRSGRAARASRAS